MSRWWAEPVLVAPADVADAARSVPSVLRSFEVELDALGLSRGARIACIVGGEAVRLRVVPWNDALSSRADRQVLALQCFAEAYGVGAAGWVVHQHAGRFGEAALAAAAGPELVAGLNSMARTRGLRLVSVQPSFVHACNTHREDLGSGLAWFVWAERYVTTALLATPREPLTVRRWATPHVAVTTLLAREWFALGMDEASCPVIVQRSPHAEPLALTQ